MSLNLDYLVGKNVITDAINNASNWQQNLTERQYNKIALNEAKKEVVNNITEKL